ncbi:hypothetical protein [Kineobactrum salinum]|uniref:Uncharacterized protein n=1 Tax=Kineobactrum salinum TaxID=2708301 RepID=A0A6C0TY20_9GAMM|nr:hypothetical protein [Kineobactrum salinum]QIB64691.1 hypothetical protein G3T16_04065 [Kineobactrum salinum]
MDSSLDCSTFRSLGQSKNLVVGPDKNALLVFDLPEEEAADLTSATLILAPSRFFGRSMEIAVFSTQPPWAQENAAREDGLASRYPGDRGIGDDSQVLFHSGFEERDWLQHWHQMTRGEMSVVTKDEGNAFQPISGPALKTTLKQGENMALNLRYLFAKHHAEEPEEIYFRYYLRFGDNWSPDLDGGKLPGLAGPTARRAGECVSRMAATAGR